MKKFLTFLLCILGVVGVAATGVSIAYCSSDEVRQTINGYIYGKVDEEKTPITSEISTNLADYNILLSRDSSNIFVSNKTTGGVYNYSITNTEFTLLYNTDLIFSLCVVTNNGNYVFISSGATIVVVYLTAEDLFVEYSLDTPIDNFELNDLENGGSVVKITSGNNVNNYYYNDGIVVALPNDLEGSIENVVSYDDNYLIETSETIYDYNVTSGIHNSILPDGSSGSIINDYGNVSVISSINDTTGSNSFVVYDKETGESVEVANDNYDSCSFEPMGLYHGLLICFENDIETYYYISFLNPISVKLVKFPEDSYRVSPQDDEVYIVCSTIGYGIGWYNLETGELIWETESVYRELIEAGLSGDSNVYMSQLTNGNYIVSYIDYSYPGAVYYNVETDEIIQILSVGIQYSLDLNTIIEYDNYTIILKDWRTDNLYKFDLTTLQTEPFKLEFTAEYINSEALNKANIWMKTELSNGNYVVSANDRILEGVVYFNITTGETTWLANCGFDFVSVMEFSDTIIGLVDSCNKLLIVADITAEQGYNGYYLSNLEVESCELLSMISSNIVMLRVWANGVSQVINLDISDLANMTFTIAPNEMANIMELIAINEDYMFLICINNETYNREFVIYDIANNLVKYIEFVNAEGETVVINYDATETMFYTLLDNETFLLEYRDFSGDLSTSSSYLLSISNGNNIAKLIFTPGEGTFLAYKDGLSLYYSSISGEGLFTFNYETSEEVVLYENALVRTWSDNPSKYMLLGSDNAEWLVYVDLYTFEVTELTFEVSVLASNSNIVSVGDNQKVFIVGSALNSTSNQYDIYIYKLDIEHCVVVDTIIVESVSSDMIVPSSLSYANGILIINTYNEGNYTINIETAELVESEQ